MRGMRGVGQKTPCPDAVCAGRLKTSRPTTNSTLIYVLSFRALLGTKIGLLGVCLFNGRFLTFNLRFLDDFSELPEAGARHKRTLEGGACEQGASSLPILDLDVSEEREDA
jgi:hypothetical protein